MSADLIERLECGHPRELAVTSAETGAFLYCELCDCRQRRNDAERMEQEHAAALRAKDAETARLLEERTKARESALKLFSEITTLKTVMIAAAEEIHEHWDAHCDAEGYGPANLMRRLEEGIPSEYGYTAGAFAQLKQRAEAAEERIRKLATTLAAVRMSEGFADHAALIIRTAIAEEREECALACELVEAEEWDRYKYGEPEYRADPYREGMSDGAGKCAAAIREGK